MPLICIKEVNHYCYWGIWEIKEDLEELLEMVDLSVEDVAEFEEVHNEIKKLEWLAGKLMVKSLVERCGARYKGINKDEVGKPFLNKLNYHISLAHSQKYVTGIINFRSSVGIDVEKIKPKVLNVQNKFLSLKEIENAGEDLETLTMYWCGKEALYKLFGKKGIIFSRDLFVDLNKSSTKCSGFIYSEKMAFTKDVIIERIEDYIIALAL